MELTIPQQAETQAEQDESLNAVTSDMFSFDEFFDFSNEEEDGDDEVFSDNLNNVDVFFSVKDESDTLLGESSSNSSLVDFGSSILTSGLCVPYDDLAELELVSTFTEESFSNEDMEKLQFISGLSTFRSELTRSDPSSNTNYPPEIRIPGKAGSKRPRIAPENWTSRILLISELIPDTDTKPMKKPKIVKKYGAEYLSADERKCLHCETDKTPQWRTGPLGQKTLCNACGVRYKSGRLVPEYRPTSSPSFVQMKHSNSHRKVMELRKKKEIRCGGGGGGVMMGMESRYQMHDRCLDQYRNVSYDGSECEGYLIHDPILEN